MGGINSKIKLASGTIIILLLCFGFSGYLTLTALAKYYKKLIRVDDQSLSLVAPFKTDFFANQQLVIPLVIFLFGCLSIVLLINFTLKNFQQTSLKKIGWPLFIISITTQLLILGIFINDFINIIPANSLAEDKLIDLFVEITTTLVISTLLFFELFILLINLLNNAEVKNSFGAPIIDPSNIRPAAFLFLLGVDLSAAFVPLHMKSLYQPLFGLPKDVVLGLPISSMFLCVSFTIVIAGIWLDRRGWHEPFLVGLFLTAGAMFYAWWAPDAVHFIFAMGLAGLGYGLALMASQGFVIVHTDEKTKARGLAYLIAGIYAGSICGTAIGAMLAERIGYRSVFLVSAITLLLTLGYTLMTMGGTIKKQTLNDKTGTQKITSSVTALHYWNFLRNRHVLGLIFLSSLPSAIAVIGLLNYFGPVYLDRLGVSQSIIGSVLILYSICIVYLGPFISQYIDATDNKRLFVFIGCVLGGGAFLSFYFFSGLTATIIAVLLLGVSSCFVLASQTTYALTLDVTKQLGQGRAIGIFRASSRIGQMLGPLLFGWLMVSTEINQGLTYFGIAYLVTAVLFMLLTFKSNKLPGKFVYESNAAGN